MKNLRTILGGTLVISFFLPWVNAGFVSFSGANMSGLVNMASSFADMGGGSVPVEAYLVYLLWLIPISGGILAYFSYSKNEKTNIATIVAGAVPLVFFLFGLIKAGGDIFSGMSIGLWITLLAAIACLLVAFDVIKAD